MSTENTKNFMNDLVNDLKPVQPLESPLKRTLMCFLIALPIAFFGSYLASSSLIGWEVRTLRFTDPKFVIEQISILAIAFLLFLTAFRSSDPNVASHSHWSQLALAPVGLITLLLILTPGETFNYGQTMMAYGYACLGTTAAGAIPAYFVLAKALRKSYIVHPQRVAYTAGIGAYALGLFGLHIMCPNSTTAFLVVWHITPLFLFGLLSRLILPKLRLN